MTPCARCNEDADSIIYTLAGEIPVCSHCSSVWWSLELGQPIETFYHEHE